MYIDESTTNLVLCTRGMHKDIATKIAQNFQFFYCRTLQTCSCKQYAKVF